MLWLYIKRIRFAWFYDGESDELPLAATYVIDQNGVIVYTFLDAEYTNRAEAKDILAALDSIKE
jgi:peroxiredoxin